METEKIRLENVKKVYFIGIGGIGISAIARFLAANGKDVSGSDIKPSKVTLGLEKLGIKINYEQKAENITDDIDLAVYTTSVPMSNPEMQAVSEKGIKAITYAESLGLIFNLREGIAVCGTHGKSSATAMIGAVLEDGGIDPSVLVGSIVPRYDGNLRIGAGKHFLAEACEYNHNFMSLYPHIVVLNNIELDHTDCYKDIGEMKESFLGLLGHLPEDGILFCNGDDENVAEVASKIKAQKPGLRTFRFGADEKNDDYYFKDYRIADGKAKFEAFRAGTSLGGFSLLVPGEFNARNAMAAIALGTELGIPATAIRASLENYPGIWRRFEIKGEYEGALVISDYAHHPTAVGVTIKAAKDFYPGRRIVAVFQPHQHNRTRGLYRDFLNCFDQADEVILAEIYDVAGREEKEDQVVSSKNIAEDVVKRNERMAGHIAYAPNLDEARKMIDDIIKPGDVVLIMGAGDIFELADSLVRAN